MSGMAARERKKRIVEKMPPPPELCWSSLILFSSASVSGLVVAAVWLFPLLVGVDFLLPPDSWLPVALDSVDPAVLSDEVLELALLEGVVESVASYA